MRNRIKTRTEIRRASLIDLIKSAGLEASLQVCLDVGDLRSYSGDRTTWKDLSGNGNDYVKASLQANGYPVFNGSHVKGTENDYWRAPYAGQNGGFIPSNTPTWDDSIHKNNGQFSLVACIFLMQPNTGQDFILINNADSSGVALNNGINVQYTRTTNRLQFRYDTDNTASSGTVQITEDPDDTGVFKFVAVSFNENGNILMKNGLRRAIATTAATASANTTNPSFPIAIGCLGDGNNGMDEGNDPRLYCIAMWTRALSSTEIETFGSLIQQQRFPTIR